MCVCVCVQWNQHFHPTWLGFSAGGVYSVYDEKYSFMILFIMWLKQSDSYSLLYHVAKTVRQLLIVISCG